MNRVEFFNELNKHQVIGWDLDSTLIGEEHSLVLRNYIKTNPNKKHHIITFRNRKLLESLREDISLETKYEDFISMFSSFNHLSNEISFDWNSSYIREFKPSIAKKIGATVLIDDLQGFLQEECEKVGITYLNPFDSIKPGIIFPV